MAERSAKQLGLSKADLPNSVIEVIATLSKSGFEAYLVGGGVRDTLLGLRPKDFDAVTNAKPHEIKDIFGKRCRVIGRRFQLAHVYSGRDMIEVATFRAPPNGDAHTTSDGMIVRDNVWGDIEQDFARRDFSINALYYQPLKGIVHDFCNALDDIKSKTLKLLGHAPVRIEEDPVRLLRALRFKAKLGFDFDKELSEQFHDDNWSLLDQVSPHRLYDESQKMFTGGYLVPLLPLLFEYGAIRHLIIYPPEKPTALVNQVAINTDKRIALGKSINPAFFYAALLWDNYLYQLDKNKQKNMPFHDAQLQAASKVIDRQRIKTAIPKFAEQFIRDIWLMQPKLANPRAKQIAQLAEQPRFRAAFDFLLLREQCDDVANPLSESTNGMGEWWQTYQTLSEKQKQQAIDDFSGDSRRGASKRGRNRNRNQETDSVAAPSNPRSQDQRSHNQSNDPHHSNQDTAINKPSRPSRSRNVRAKESHYAREREQLQKLSLGEVAGEQVDNNKQPSPLFTINADKMAKQVPQQAAISAQSKKPSDQPNSSRSHQSKANSQAESEQSQQNDSQHAHRKAKSEVKSTSINSGSSNRRQPDSNASPSSSQSTASHEAQGMQVVGNAVLLPKAEAIPSKRRRRLPSSEVTQAERASDSASTVVSPKATDSSQEKAAESSKAKASQLADRQATTQTDDQPVEKSGKPTRTRRRSAKKSTDKTDTATGSDAPEANAADLATPKQRARKKAPATAKPASKSEIESTDADITSETPAKPANGRRRKSTAKAESSKEGDGKQSNAKQANSSSKERVPATRRRRAPSTDKTVNERSASDK